MYFSMSSRYICSAPSSVLKRTTCRWRIWNGVVRDYVQAVALYQLAAAQTFVEAQYDLGRMYDDGQGVARDHAEALRLFQLAAAQGHAWAVYNIAFCHEYGDGVSKNKATAIRL